MNMKKTISLMISMLLLVAMVMTGCGGSNGDETTAETTSVKNNTASIDSFAGEWDCDDTYLESDDGYTGFYELDVEKNGEFSLYDAEAGNPGIAGTMTVDSDTEVTVTCEEEDFDPPAEWMNMTQDGQVLQYEFVSEDELHLAYTEGDNTATLVFHRIDGEEEEE